MQQTRTSKTFGLILLVAGGLQLLLLLISMITSLFFPVEDEMRPDWSYILITLLLLGIIALGISSMRQRHIPPALSQHLGIPVGLMLGILSAILLYTPLRLLLFYAALGLPWLIGILFTSPGDVYSISLPFALVSVALYLVFAACFCLCVSSVVQRGGSVRQGLWSSIQAALATFPSTTLTFSLIDIVAYFVFHRESDLAAPSSFSSFSPLVNYMASYMGIVQLLAIWLLVPVVLGLLLAIPSAFFSRGPTLRSGSLAAERANDKA
jgi:hypothetical protein